MRFTNFVQVQSVTLSVLGQHGDLHNFAEFSGLELVPESGCVRLRWDLLDAGARFNPAKWCAIRFDDVTGVWLTRVAAGTPPGNARTLTSIGPSGSEARLRFEFMDGCDIEVAAGEATLESDLAARTARP